MKKKSLLFLSFSAALFIFSCNKTDMSTAKDNANNSTNNNNNNNNNTNNNVLIPVVSFALGDNAVTVCEGCSKYIAIESYWPFNATLVKEAFSFAYGTTGTSVVTASFIDEKRLIKVTGTTIGTENTFTVSATGVTSKSTNPAGNAVVVSATVIADDDNGPASDLVVSAGGQSSVGGVLELTVMQNAKIPLVLAAKKPNGDDVTGFGGRAEQIFPLSMGASEVGFVTGATAQLTVADVAAGKEYIAFGSKNNHDVNVTLNLNIVGPPATFKTTPIGDMVASLGGNGGIALSTLNGSNDPAVTGQAVGASIGTAGVLIQQISAAGMLKIFDALPVANTLTLGAYSVKVTPAGKIIPTLEDDMSLTLKSAAGIMLGDIYTVTLSNTATPAASVSFTITIGA